MSQLIESKWTHKLIRINDLIRELDNHENTIEHIAPGCYLTGGQSYEKTRLRLESFYLNLFLAKKLLILEKKQTMERIHTLALVSQTELIYHLIICISLCFNKLYSLSQATNAGDKNQSRNLLCQHKDLKTN